MGCFDGSVIIRDKAGTEKTRIETGESPVWALCWNPSVSTIVCRGLNQLCMTHVCVCACVCVCV